MIWIKDLGQVYYGVTYNRVRTGLSVAMVLHIDAKRY